MLGILNKLTLQQELQNCEAKNVCFRPKSKNTTTTKTKITHESPCRNRELNLGPLAFKADALPLHHRVN